ncbi:MAG TPA: small ribosomal subunit Rsm22 family protein [Opitutaceae bacterium]
MTWSELDWAALDRLREGFLSGAAAAGPYWRSRSDLASYDFTYGERIGWKWGAVLRELTLRGWTPPEGVVLDWGCGSGVAGRRVLGAFGPERFSGLSVWDHSTLAREFAADAARAAYPGFNVDAYRDGEPFGLLVLSHVLNELDADAQAAVADLIARATAVIWIEPGTSDVSRTLVEWRERLRAQFNLVAPCTHAAVCGMLGAGNERHWCHHFASPPAGIYADSNWVRFGQRAGIDLRSLPYSFLVLDRRPPPALPADGARIIGRPEHFKPYARFLNCDVTGVHEVTLPKRADLALYKQLERTKGPLLYRWRRNGATADGGEPLFG